MNCPLCPGALDSVYSTTGVELDRCRGCGAVWFDRGEVYLFFRDRAPLAAAVEAAKAAARLTDKKSPRTGKTLLQCALPAGGGSAYLDVGGGLLVPGDAIKALNRARALDLRFLTTTTQRPQELPRLPNLPMRSFATLVGLYGLLSLLLITLSLFAGVAPGIALLIATVVVLIQFALGPFFMDLSLRMLYKMRFVEARELPSHLQSFVTRVSREQGMRFPRFGIIDDQAPNAFTYGHTPQNARLVITSGLYELLEPAELEAVVAHEIGHAKHWDMAVMTFAQLVPMLLYYLYRAALSAKPRDSRARGVTTGVAVGAYLLYIVSEYVVLWLSRTRELYADRFAGEVTRSPAALARGLVKIAYGLAGRGQATDQAQSGARAKAIGALGIFDAGAAQTLAVSSYRVDSAAAAKTGGGGGYTIDREGLKGAMKWDLWNPWATYYEIHSTHPLTARRLLQLSAQSRKLGEEPFVLFDLPQPESYWDEFLVDVGVTFLPVLVFVATILIGFAWPGVWGFGLLAVAAAMAVKLRFRYPTSAFPEMSVQTLLKEVKVSDIRPVPCRLQGTVRGKGVPGLIWSEDFVLQDDTGIMMIDHRQPLAIWEWIWGWMRGDSLIGEHVAVVGWYRRAPVPYVELAEFTVAGKRRRSYLRHFRWATVALVAALGVLALLASPA